MHLEADLANFFSAPGEASDLMQNKIRVLFVITWGQELDKVKTLHSAKYW